MGDTPLTADDLARLRDAVERSADRDQIIHRDRLLALLDMVDGLKQLVREADPDTSGRVLPLPGGWKWTERHGTRSIGVPLATARPDLAALLDLALTPQGDEEA